MASTVKLDKGEVLFRAGDPGDACYVVRSGLLKSTVSSPRGDPRIIALMGPGALAGKLSMIDGRGHAVSVEAMVDSVVLRIGQQAFRQALIENHVVADLVMKDLAAQLRQVIETTAAESYASLQGRVAQALTVLARQLGQRDCDGQVLIGHEIRHADIAAMTGVARESVSRTLSDWRRRGVVTAVPGGGLKVRVDDLEKEIASAG